MCRLFDIWYAIWYFIFNLKISAGPISATAPFEESCSFVASSHVQYPAESCQSSKYAHRNDYSWSRESEIERLCVAGVLWILAAARDYTGRTFVLVEWPLTPDLGQVGRLPRAHSYADADDGRAEGGGAEGEAVAAEDGWQRWRGGWWGRERGSV